MINRLTETNPPVEVQDTTFAIDVLGRYICTTWEEATLNGGVAFDAVVIGRECLARTARRKFTAWAQIFECWYLTLVLSSSQSTYRISPASA